MDLLKEIKAKIEIVRAGEAEGDGLDAIVRHVEMAESHLAEGRKRAIQDYFTDAIYRSNQAFEGALKEAYQRLTEQDASRKTPSQIEKYLETGQRLKPRVLQLLTNYRQEWRNSSTHDHKLFFDAQEAYLAIVSVSAFASILLDQIIESRAFQIEAKRLSSNRKALPKVSANSRVGLFKSLAMLLESYGKTLNEDKSDLSSPLALYGRVAAFLEAAVPSASVAKEVPVQLISGVNYRADFVVARKEESVLLEVKLGGDRQEKDLVTLAAEQMATLLRSYDGSPSGGIVFLVSRSKRDVNVAEYPVRTGSKELPLVIVQA